MDIDFSFISFPSREMNFHEPIRSLCPLADEGKNGQEALCGEAGVMIWKPPVEGRASFHSVDRPGMGYRSWRGSCRGQSVVMKNIFRWFLVPHEAP